ncbi:hypothetical protein BDV93DRAFT_252074 [Ceratobasidium sp. AG-I]|nr:hypothetical protein BDV93DRAFT_252074 [Ceratobasidium sp. AG-I]
MGSNVFQRRPCFLFWFDLALTSFIPPSLTGLPECGLLLMAHRVARTPSGGRFLCVVDSSPVTWASGDYSFFNFRSISPSGTLAQLVTLGFICPRKPLHGARPRAVDPGDDRSPQLSLAERRIVLIPEATMYNSGDSIFSYVGRLVALYWSHIRGLRTVSHLQYDIKYTALNTATPRLVFSIEKSQVRQLLG